MNSKRFGAIAVSNLLFPALCVVGCGSSEDASSSGLGSPTTTSSTSATGTSTTGTGDPGPCGGEAQKCCSSGALCGAGLTCSDEYCLVCGPPPASLAGCHNVAHGAVVSATTSAGSMPDDPTKGNDDDVCTSWNYGNFADANTSWQVDLGSVQSLQAITLWPKMTPADGDVTFHLQYKSAEADAFTEYPSTTGLTLMLHDYRPWQTTFSPPIMARYFRVAIASDPSYAALREVGLYSGCTQ